MKTEVVWIIIAIFGVGYFIERELRRIYFLLWNYFHQSGEFEPRDLDDENTEQ